MKPFAQIPHTIYLDVEPILTRSSLLFMSVVFLALGFSGYYHHTDSLPWLHRLQILTGLFGLAKAIHNIYYVKKYGRNRLVFTDENLEYKIKQHGTMNGIPWQDIERITLTFNTLELTLKSIGTAPIKLKLRQFPLWQAIDIDQQIRNSLPEYTSNQRIVIQ